MAKPVVTGHNITKLLKFSRKMTFAGALNAHHHHNLLGKIFLYATMGITGGKGVNQ